MWRICVRHALRRAVFCLAVKFVPGFSGGTAAPMPPRWTFEAGRAGCATEPAAEEVGWAKIGTMASSRQAANARAENGIFLMQKTPVRFGDYRTSSERETANRPARLGVCALRGIDL